MSNYVFAGITGREVAGLWRAELYNETLSLGLIVQIRRISYTQVTTIKQFLCILCIVCTSYIYALSVHWHNSTTSWQTNIRCSVLLCHCFCWQQVMSRGSMPLIRCDSSQSVIQHAGSLVLGFHSL